VGVDSSQATLGGPVEAMKALVLGANGMLGQQVLRTFGERFETTGTIRGSADRIASPRVFFGARIVANVDVMHAGSIEAVVRTCGPAVVVNCIGLIKQLPDAQDEKLAVAVNGLLPHELATLGERYGFRLIHISTDCVFSGNRGHYTEADVPDAGDLYGRSKIMGEVVGSGCLTLRTSLIGPELDRNVSLLEWFLSQAGGRVRGYRRAVFSGLTTSVLAGEVVRLVEHFTDLSGLYHVAAEPINKYDLLVLIRDAFGIDVDIQPDEEFVCDRSLDGTRYRTATGFIAPAWPAMVGQLAEEYHNWKRQAQ
jgi:dTDP-4-dehydrorhamnose reductase